MQVADVFQIGEMLHLVEYNCEGIEEPWGFPPEILTEMPDRAVVSGSMFRRRSQNARRRLSRGDIAIVINHMHIKHPAIDAFYVVLVGGQKLCVYPRFLTRLGV